MENNNKNTERKEYTVKPYSQEEVDRILGEIDEDVYKRQVLCFGRGVLQAR